MARPKTGLVELNYSMPCCSSLLPALSNGPPPLSARNKIYAGAYPQPPRRWYDERVNVSFYPAPVARILCRRLFNLEMLAWLGFLGSHVGFDWGSMPYERALFRLAYSLPLHRRRVSVILNDCIALT